MKNKILFLLFLLIFCFLASSALGQERVSVVAYYPAPFGVYRILRVLPAPNPGACQEGEVYYDSATRSLYYCDESPAWQSLSAGEDTNWILNEAPDPDFLYVSDINTHVGIGTRTPVFKLTMDNYPASSGNLDGGIIAKGNFGVGATLTTAGAGTRLIWYPRKAAFRAGYVSGSQWNDSNIGNYSVALGRNATADHQAAIAIGNETQAINDYAIAMGYYQTASGSNSVVIGSNSTASANFSFVLGCGVNNTNRLVNNIPNSLMVGFNSTVPTLFVGKVVGSDRVGIGTSVPSHTLTVNGDAFKSLAPDTWLVTSDIRIKTDIQDIDNGLDIISRLRPIKFRYTKEYKENHPSIKGHYYFSFIAQEFQKVFPDSVEEGSDSYLMMDTSAVTPYLVAAVKQTYKTIEQLQKENKELRQELNTLVPEK